MTDPELPPEVDMAVSADLLAAASHPVHVELSNGTVVLGGVDRRRVEMLWPVLDRMNAPDPEDIVATMRANGLFDPDDELSVPPKSSESGE